MRKKNKHPSPTEYRIRYTINGSHIESIQYYNVFHSSEAIDFLAHTFRQGHIDGKNLSIQAVEEFERFTKKWLDRTDKAAAHAEAPELFIEDGHAWLRKKN